MIRIFKMIGLRRQFSVRYVSYKNVEYTPIIMPKLSPTATESKVEEWLVNEGDFIEAGDSYCTIETDKASLSHDAQESGYIARLFKSEGKIPINSLIGVQVEAEKDVAAFKDFKPTDFGSETGSSKSAAKPTSEQKTESKPDAETSPQPEKAAESVSQPGAQTQSSRVPITPYAQTLARENKIELSGVTPSGIDGAITARDVATASGGKVDLKKQPSSKGSVPSAERGVGSGAVEAGAKHVDIPHTAMRETIAKRLLESKQTIPHFYLTMECKVDNLIKLRKQLNSVKDTKISVNDLIIKASALALKQVKEVNSSWNDTFTRQYQAVDISVAVSTPTGLLTPIIKDADTKGLRAISAEMKELASRARDGKLKPNEFLGGTFTISNLGMMGITNFSAIINPPQSAILAVGTTKSEAYLDSEKNLQSRMVMTVTLACDHRTVDGAKAAEWLNAFKSFIEEPTNMLL